MENCTCLIPKSHADAATWTTLIAKQKALRLQSLLTSPESFSSTYERESAFDDSVWEARLRNPSAYTHTAVSRLREGSLADDVLYSQDELKMLLECEWAGSAVLVGPATMDSQEEHGSVCVFDIFGLFVLPGARGTGLGSALMDACIEHARRLAGALEVEKVKVRVSVACGNAKVMRFYQRLGFVEKEEAGGDVGSDVRKLVKEMEV